MPRSQRPSLPGAFFHITTRTQDKALWFDEEVRDQIVIALAKSVPKSDARLHALVVMSNHLHMVVRQGMRPLADLLQPFLARVASLVHRKRPISGHIMGGRFFSVHCEHAEQLRRAITYVHHNPIKAGLCAKDADYRWSSHATYMSGRDMLCADKAGTVLPLEACTWVFASGEGRTAEGLRDDYREYFLDWCKRKELEAKGEVVRDAPVHFAALAHWRRQCGPIVSPSSAVSAAESSLPDIALRVIAERAPGMPLDLVRSRVQTFGIVEVRRQIIERALAAGHRACEIARFLGVSDALVSMVRHRAAMSK